MIRVTCPHCQTKMELAAPPASGVVACTTCQHRLQVRAPGASPAGHAAQPHAAGGHQAPRHAPASPRARHEDDDDHPRRRKSRHRHEEQKSSALPWIIVGSVCGVVVIGAIVVLVMVLGGDDQKPIAQGPRESGFVAKRDPWPKPQPVEEQPEEERKPATPSKLGGRTSEEKRSKRDEEKPGKRSDETASETPSGTTEQPSGFASGGGGGGGTGVYPYLLKSAAFIVVLQEVQGPQGRGMAMANGSGSLIDRKNRLVLTNHHVAGDAQDVIVFFPGYVGGKLVAEKEQYINRVRNRDKNNIKARVLASDMRCDLCLLQLERLPEGIEALPLSKVQATPGQPVHSIGNPGASGGLWVYTSGTVRQVYHFKWRSRGGGSDRTNEHDADVVETQSPTNPGDSGGPLVNDRGELVGVTQGGSSAGNLVSVFVDVGEVRRFVESAFEAKLGSRWISDARAPLQIAGRTTGGNVTALIKDLEHADATRRARAAEALGDMGENARIAFPSLLNALKDKDDLTRRAAAASLAKIGPPAKGDLPLLASAAKDQSLEVRRYAINTLAQLGPEARSAADALVNALKDEDAFLRQSAARALGKLGPDVKATAAKELTALLDHKEKDTRIAAAEGLAAMLTTAPDLTALQKMMKHQDAEVRAFAARGVGKLGKDAKPALTELLDAAKTDAGDIRKAALMVLAGLTAVEVKPSAAFLNQALKEGDKETKQLSLQAIAKLGTEAGPCINDLRIALRDPDVCKDVLATLSKCGATAKNAVPGMIECLRNDDESVRDAALKALGDLGTTGAPATGDCINLFDKAREKKSEQEASAHLDKVAAVVAKFGRTTVQPLVRALQEDNAMIRWGACKALGYLGPTASGAAGPLQTLSQIEPNQPIAQEAEKALRKVRAR